MFIIFKGNGGAFLTKLFYVNQPVKHKNKKLHEAKFHSWSQSGKRVGVIHNAAYPLGVSWVVDWFDPKNIEAVK